MNETLYAQFRKQGFLADEQVMSADQVLPDHACRAAAGAPT